MALVQALRHPQISQFSSGAQRPQNKLNIECLKLNIECLKLNIECLKLNIECLEGAAAPEPTLYTVFGLKSGYGEVAPGTIIRA